jgi:exodeoxyribonuclease-1
MAQQASMFWYDYETFGTDPRRDRIAQFAGIRTDEDLNIIGEPVNILCRAADDVLPQPDACLITGLTPQYTREQGLIETEFMARVEEEFATPGTCVVGFNNIRFDDEFTRYALYRNFFDPYAREWQNGCSRWDIIDMLRITRALRPEGISWPVNDDGSPSNRLELITAANGISHQAAHDALSDVHATIAVAKLIRDKQPRLYDYIYQNRQKHAIAQLLNVAKAQPVLHASGMYPGEICNTAMVLPLAPHPKNKNGIIVYDLRYDPEALIELDVDSIRQRLYTPRDELPEGSERIPLKTIHINKCPVVAPLNTLDDASATRIGIDREQHFSHMKKLQATAGLSQKVQQVFDENNFEPISDPDQNLYGGGFFSDDDRQRMQTIRNTPAEQLARLNLNFDDERLPEMLFRYRARNYPHTLDTREQQRWQDYKRDRFTLADGGASITLDNYMQRIAELMGSDDYDEKQQAMLAELKAYGELIANELAAYR